MAEITANWDKRYRIAICDDEPQFVEEIREMTNRVLADAGIDPEIFECGNPKDLLREAERRGGSLPFDIILLDILMREMDGMELALRLRKKGIHSGLVFITVSPEFVYQGYGAEALRYLLKPPQEEELRKVLLLQWRRLHSGRKLIVLTRGRTFQIPVVGIHYAESSGGEVRIHSPERTTGISVKLDELENLLPGDCFLRCHKSFLVNIRQITAIRRYELELEGGILLPVSKRYYRNVKTKLLDYLMNCLH